MSSVTFMYLLVSNFVQKIRKMLWANTEQTILQTEEFDEFIEPSSRARGPKMITGHYALVRVYYSSNSFNSLPH